MNGPQDIKERGEGVERNRGLRRTHHAAGVVTEGDTARVHHPKVGITHPGLAEVCRGEPGG